MNIFFPSFIYCELKFSKGYLALLTHSLRSLRSLARSLGKYAYFSKESSSCDNWMSADTFFYLFCRLKWWIWKAVVWNCFKTTLKTQVSAMKPRENDIFCIRVREIGKMQHAAWRRTEMSYSSKKSKGCGCDSFVGTFFCIRVREIRRLRLSMQFCSPRLKNYGFVICTRVREINRFSSNQLGCLLTWAG